MIIPIPTSSKQLSDLIAPVLKQTVVNTFARVASQELDKKILRAKDNTNYQKTSPQNTINETIATNNFKNSTTDGQLYFVVITKSSYYNIEIQYVPQEINYKRKANYNNLDVIMRNIPKPHYTGGDTTMSLQLDFNANNNSRTDLINRIRKIEALAYADGFNEAPPIIKLVWGKLFRKEHWIVTSVNYKLHNFKQKNNFLPQHATVDIDLQLVSFNDPKISNTNPTWGDVQEDIFTLNDINTQADINTLLA